MKDQKIDTLGLILIIFLFALLGYAGFLSYQSIDFKVLEKLEAQKIVLPPPVSTNSAAPAVSTSPSRTP